jgi:hypothetical protein
VRFVGEGQRRCFTAVPWFSGQPPPSMCALPSPRRRWLRLTGGTRFHGQGRHGPQPLGPTGSLLRQLLPSSPLCDADWMAPCVSACPWVRACARLASLTSGPVLSVAPPVMHQCPRVPVAFPLLLPESSTRGPHPPDRARAHVPHQGCPGR